MIYPQEYFQVAELVILSRAQELPKLEEPSQTASLFEWFRYRLLSKLRYHKLGQVKPVGTAGFIAGADNAAKALLRQTAVNIDVSSGMVCKDPLPNPSNTYVTFELVRDLFIYFEFLQACSVDLLITNLKMGGFITPGEVFPESIAAHKRISQTLFPSSHGVLTTTCSLLLRENLILHETQLNDLTAGCDLLMKSDDPIIRIIGEVMLQEVPSTCARP